MHTLIVFGIAFVSGARFDGGAVGPLVTLLAACLISVVIAARSALSAAPDWGAILPRMGLLALLAIAMAELATRAFRTYQGSL